MPAVRAGRLVLRRRRVATSAADGGACLKSGQSSPVCSVRSQLQGPLGGCSCRAMDRGYERGAFGARVALRTCQARAALHTVRKTALNWQVSNIAAGSGRLWQGASARCQVLSQVKLCEKKNCELRSLTSLCSCERDCRVAGGGPTSAPSAPPQYEGAPNYATAKYRRRCTDFFHCAFTVSSNSRMGAVDSPLFCCEKVSASRQEKPSGCNGNGATSHSDIRHAIAIA